MRRILITMTIILLAFCLYAATQEVNVTSENILQEVPDILVLEQFSEQYAPVTFDHKLHTQPMTEMGIECSSCHHYSKPDYFPPCSKCHHTKSDEINSTFPLNRPSIEAAYHRQCVNCHREWSRDIIECSSCHVERGAGERVDEHVSVTEASDDKKVYETDKYQKTIVTFLHREHLELFEVDCVSCHREGNCSICHPLDEEEETEEVAISKEDTTISSLERHKLCVSCHSSWVFPPENVDKEQYCQKCHTETQKQKFDHAQSSGWPLKQYHLTLSCSECHIIKGEFGKLETGCDVCHRGWTPENFNHSVTGLALDEDHRDIACKDCHIDSKFDEEPSCSGSECHEEDIKYPESLPGPKSNEK